ncbi:MAG: acylhydrolase [Paludibacteraceae bacterium]|nr:acylhydrolase [Paludibacteraceae bacterium]
MRAHIILSVLLLSALTVNAQNDKQHDWAQFYRYAESNAAITEGKIEKPRVVFMGNSITDHWAQQRPEFFDMHNFAGRGISGQTSSEMLVRFQADVIDLHPKYVVILSGINDIARNNGYISLNHILQNIISMCQIAKVNKIKPIICSLTPCKQFTWRKELQPAENIVELNKMLREYAKKNHITYVDYWSALAADDKGMRAEYTTDGCHLTAEGYSVMEEIILNTLRKAGIK